MSPFFHILSFFAISTVFFFQTPIVLAQDSVKFALPDTNVISEEGPHIIGDTVVQVGRKAIFRASVSSLSASTSSLMYVWNFSDHPSAFERGIETVHTFDQTGTSTVTLELRTGGGTQKILSKEIFVYDKKIILITDTARSEDVAPLENQAAKEGNFLLVLSAGSSESFFLGEDRLVQLFTEHSSDLLSADMVIFHTPSARGLQAFVRYWQSLPAEEKVRLENLVYATITNREFSQVRFVASPAVSIIQPRLMLLTGVKSLSTLVVAKGYDTVTTTLRTADIHYQVLSTHDPNPWWHVLWRLLTELMARCTPANVIYLLLIIPFIVLLTVFARQVLGMPTFGVYAPVMTSAAFFVIGVKFGLAIFFFVVAVSSLVKYVLNRAHLLYISKVGLNLALLSISLIVPVALLAWFGTTISLSFAIFPMLLMSTVAEKFIAAQSEEGLWNAVIGVVSTLFIVL
ncbi:MAG: 7TM domain-containing protein, partial [Patescibacteria group bacterium]